VLAAPGEPPEVAALLVGERAGDAQLEQLGVADHGVDRRAQLVAHRGQERGLRLVRGVGAATRRLGAVLGCQGRGARRLRLVEQPLDLAPGAHLFGDVGAVGDHARARPVALDEREVHEIDEPLLQRPVGRTRQRDRDPAADERLARGEHAVEEADEALRPYLGQGLVDRPADEGAVADEARVRVVRERDDVVGPAEDHQERRRLAEHVGESFALDLEGRHELRALVLGHARGRDVGEQDRDLPGRGVADAEGEHVEPAPHRAGAELEAHLLAGRRHMAVGLDPVGLDAGTSSRAVRPTAWTSPDWRSNPGFVSRNR
jgi:hypothetical protein